MSVSDPGVAVVSGGGSGLGAAMAEALSRRGHRLALIGRRTGPLERTLAGPSSPGRVWALDVRDSPAVEGCAREVEHELGAVSVVVAAAGIAKVASFSEQSDEDFRATVETNLIGAAQLFRAFLPPMLARGRGTLVGVLSVAARNVFAGWSAYAASKWGLLGLLESLRVELQGSGVRVLALTPGATATPLWDGVLGEWDRSKMIAAADVAEALVWALDHGEGAVVEEIRMQPPGGNL